MDLEMQHSMVLQNNISHRGKIKRSFIINNNVIFIQYSNKERTEPLKK